MRCAKLNQPIPYRIKKVIIEKLFIYCDVKNENSDFAFHGFSAKKLRSKSEGVVEASQVRSIDPCIEITHLNGVCMCNFDAGINALYLTGFHNSFTK